MKKILILLLSVVFSINMYGCNTIIGAQENTMHNQGTVKNKNYTNEEKKEMVLKYLKDKYGEEFVGASCEFKGLDQSWDEYYVYPKSGTSEDEFCVWGDYDEDGTYFMNDGYFGIIIHDEYEKTMRGIVEEFVKDFELYVDTKTQTVYSGRYNKNTKMSELYKKGEIHGVSSWTCITLHKNKTEIDAKELLNKIAKKMTEKKLLGQITIFIKDQKGSTYRRDAVVSENDQSGKLRIRFWEEEK